MPAIGLFRNGQFVQYEGDETSEKQILAWLTDEETLKIIGVIDEVKTILNIKSLNLSYILLL